ncbi:MAG: twin-arginine translocase subunit TatC, partial [Acidimicrobiales bacterium]
IVASMTLFAFGATMAYLVFPPGLTFLSRIGGGDLVNLYTPSKYFGLLTIMVLAFGAAFEFPVVLVSLELAGVLSSARLRKWRRGAIVGIVTFAAVITPSQDPYSLFGMAVPMYLFYEASILVGRLLDR